MPVKVSLACEMVKPEFPLKDVQQSVLLVDAIDKELNGITADKFDPELIKYVCEKIENQFKSKEDDKAHRMSKLDVFFQIYDKLFSNQISDVDKKIITKMIEHMLKHKLVKKIPLSKIMVYWMKKKILD